MKRAVLALTLAFVPVIASVSCSGKDPDSGGSLMPGAIGGSASGTAAGGSTAGSTAGTASPGGNTAGNPSGMSGMPSGIVTVPPAADLTPVVTDYKQDATGESGLDKPTLDTLRAGGKSCTAKVVYPYEGTIFPGGLISPVIMWEGASDAAYVRMKYDTPTNVDVQFAAKGTNPGELRVPQKHWNEITRRSMGGTLQVTLTTRSGAAVSTCELKWRVARGNMTGALYYNTYNHPQSNGVGAVLRLSLGAAAPELYLSENGMAPVGPCISCHSVSAQGGVLAASSHNYTPFLGAAIEQFRSFVTPITDQLQPKNQTGVADASFGALTPDGKLLLQMGNPQCTAGADSFPRAPNNFFLVQGPTKALLRDTATGMAVETKGLDPNHYMWMPQFSPDGKHVVFNHAKPDGKGGSDRRELAMMDFDQPTRTFSNLRVIASRQGVEPSLPYNPTSSSGGISPLLAGAEGCSEALQGDAARGAQAMGSCTGPCYPAWPFFTPDGRGVIYSLISEPDFAVAFPGRDVAAKSELWYANVDDPARPVQFRMDNANKALAGEDVLNNYYPTVLPVQVGGYYWVFWTSMRKFGHRKIGGDAPAGGGTMGGGQMGGGQFGGLGGLLGGIIPGIPGTGMAEQQATKKRIWVSAIRASGTGTELGSSIGADPSLPGFYLEGQSETGNTRAFAALNPCRKTGNDCASGLDCCTGFCDIKPGAEKGKCVEEVKCAKTNERCKTTADCCPPAPGEVANQCLGGYCGFIVLN